MNDSPPLLDVGRPLVAPADLAARYVELHPPDELHHWLDSLPDDRPSSCLVYGQVGIGKTTLVHRCLQLGERRPDAEVDLSNQPWSPTEGVVLLVASAALDDKERFLLPLLRTSGSPLADEAEPTARLREIIAGTPGNRPLLERRYELESWADARVPELRHLCEQALTAMADRLGRRPLLWVKGLDVLRRRDAWYHGIRSALERLMDWPAHHLVEVSWSLGRDSEERWQDSIDQHIVLRAPAESAPLMEDLLSLRMGMHAGSVKAAIPHLARASGGLPRQAIRLLLEYLAGRTRHRLDSDGALERACRRTRNLLLATRSPPTSVERLRAVERDGGIGPGEDSDEAILRTWVVVVEGDRSDLLVPARVNPLLRGLISADNRSLDPPAPEPPEARWWKEIARQQDMSPAGVEPGEDLSADPERLHAALEDLGLWENELGVVELLEELSRVLLLPRSLHVPVILYRYEEVAELAMEATLGLHGASGNEVPETATISRPVDLDEALGGSPRTGLSLLLRPADGDMTKKVVDRLEKRRSDLLALPHVLIWLHERWLPWLLRHGPHLRPFLAVYELEKELVAGLDREQFQQEIEELEEVIDDEDSSEVWRDARTRLLNVLRLLEGGENNDR